jgi:6-phosphogluconolactonase/glucosamine-6-phosphate isomerase/deaminase
MTLELEVVATATEAEERVAALVADRAADADGAFALALSKAPAALLSGLAESLYWERVAVFQVDERVAPPGSPDRNLTALVAALPADRVRAMPVDDPDLEAAARQYAAELPASLDLVHLGLGPDGHTASLVPGDPVLDVDGRLVAVTAEYLGYRRLTLTYPALNATREIVWLVTGEEKREALGRLLARDPSIPATGVIAARQIVVADAAAAGS